MNFLLDVAVNIDVNGQKASLACQHFPSFTLKNVLKQRLGHLTYFLTLGHFLFFKKVLLELVKTKTMTMTICVQGCEQRNKNKQMCSLAYPNSSLPQHALSKSAGYLSSAFLKQHLEDTAEKKIEDTPNTLPADHKESTGD